MRHVKITNPTDCTDPGAIAHQLRLPSHRFRDMVSPIHRCTIRSGIRDRLHCPSCMRSTSNHIHLTKVTFISIQLIYNDYTPSTCRFSDILYSRQSLQSPIQLVGDPIRDQDRLHRLRSSFNRLHRIRCNSVSVARNLSEPYLCEMVINVTHSTQHQKHRRQRGRWFWAADQRRPIQFRQRFGLRKKCLSSKEVDPVKDDAIGFF
uniref:Uncharacterized protein n=1 Tax=Haemonchus contortus TaxID=6289 RepID=A0A7I4XT32_HAECO